MEGFVQGLSYGVGYICAISGNREDLEKVPAAAQKIYEDKQAWCKALPRNERSSHANEESIRRAGQIVRDVLKAQGQ